MAVVAIELRIYSHETCCLSVVAKRCPKKPAVTCLAYLLGQEQWWLVCAECSSVLVVMAAALGVVSYSIVTVVDMACNTTLPAACLLDEILADLACELRY